ncbi:MAG: hypothetical protein HY315_10405 [Acidobacteria bacterium]|nr:hypothetical protein [Acidobacteriota bacterium]
MSHNASVITLMVRRPSSRWAAPGRAWRLAAGAVVLCWLGGSARGDSTLVFPHLPAGGDVITTVTLTNTNFDTPVTGTLGIFSQNGTPRMLAVEGLAPASSFQITIPAGGSRTLTTTVGGNISLGMARFTSDFPAGGVVRFQIAGSQIGVLSSTPQDFGTLIYDTTGGNETGMAVANPGSAPLNISLVHAGPDGVVLETVDPPELNPVAPNGQVSKFLPEFGLRQTANRSGHTIRIQPRGGGKFSALGLVLRNNLLSSTAVVRGSTGRFSFEEFSQAYTGSWRNTTFGTQGTTGLTLAVNLLANLVVINLTLGGEVFGGPPPSGPVVLTGTFSDRGFTATGNAVPFGPMTLVIGADGSWTFTANSIPNPNITSLRITGTARPDRIIGNFTVTFVGGGANPPAVGTLTLNRGL